MRSGSARLLSLYTRDKRECSLAGGSLCNCSGQHARGSPGAGVCHCRSIHIRSALTTTDHMQNNAVSYNSDSVPCICLF